MSELFILQEIPEEYPLIEFLVNPDAAPFLVSRQDPKKSPFLWVPNSSRRKTVRAAFRSPLNWEREAIVEIHDTALQKQWGSVFPFKAEGVHEAWTYLTYHNIPDVEVVFSSEAEKASLPFGPVLSSLPVAVESWVPPGLAVLLSKDRGYFGIKGKSRSGFEVVCVHNPGRGMAFLDARMG